MTTLTRKPTLQFATEEKDHARLGELPSAEHGDLPRPATSPSVSRFTPGPWDAGPIAKSDGEWLLWAADPDSGLVYDKYPARITGVAKICGTPRAAANARLIAAAPDLLAACKEFVRKCECGEASSVRSYKQMKAAIAKAEGA